MSILYSRTTAGTVEEVGQRLEKAATERQFGVLGVVDIKQKMNSKGVDFGPECRIYEVCHPERAKRVLERKLEVSTALPCRISVYEADGGITVCTMLPTEMLRMFDAPDLGPVAESVEEDIKGIIDATVAAS
jgi:uncharacterized protein (DUF302 family)